MLQNCFEMLSRHYIEFFSIRQICPGDDKMYFDVQYAQKNIRIFVNTWG